MGTGLGKEVAPLLGGEMEGLGGRFLRGCMQTGSVEGVGGVLVKRTFLASEGGVIGAGVGGSLDTQVQSRLK
jgi:hypothetical protein